MKTYFTFIKLIEKLLEEEIKFKITTTEKFRRVFITFPDSKIKGDIALLDYTSLRELGEEEVIIESYETPWDGDDVTQFEPGEEEKIISLIKTYL